MTVLPKKVTWLVAGVDAHVLAASSLSDDESAKDKHAVCNTRCETYPEKPVMPSLMLPPTFLQIMKQTFPVLYIHNIAVQTSNLMRKRDDGMIYTALKFNTKTIKQREMDFKMFV
jgi:hypothetical protein